jgi:hypothetical protein
MRGNDPVEKRDINLRQKTIAAYEASPLKKADVEKNKAAFSLIKHFLSILGVNVEVNSNPFEVDEIRFYVDPLEDSDGIYGYDVMASRKCSSCGERIVMSVKNYNFDKYSPEMFGRWLSEPHLCEFRDEKDVRTPVGFIRSDKR